MSNEFDEFLKEDAAPAPAQAAPADNEFDSFLAESEPPAENPHDFVPAMKNAGAGLLKHAKDVGTGLVNAVSHPLDTINAVDTSNLMSDNLHGLGRAARSVPYLGDIATRAALAVPATGAGLGALSEGGDFSQAYNESFNADMAANEKSDQEHTEEHPVTDALQRSAGLAGLPAGWLAKMGVMGADSYQKSRNAGNDVSDSAKDARNSAALMGAADLGAGVLGKLAKKAGSAATDVAENRAASALGWGKSARSKFGNDAAKQAGRVGLDEKVVTPLASTGDKLDRMRNVQERAGKGIGDTMDSLDKADIKEFNPLSTASKVHNEMGSVYADEPLFGGQAEQYNRLMQTIAKRGSNNISFGEAQDLKELLGRYGYKEGIAVPGREQAQQAYGIVNRELDNSVGRGAAQTGDPGLLSKLQKAKGDYAVAKNTIPQLESKEAAELGNNKLSLTDAALAAPQLATPGGAVKAAATVGLRKGAMAYGNNFMAVGANTAAKVLATAPESLGRYAPLLQRALDRGPEAFAATHAMLMKNPEYAQLVGADQP